ncbi:hypothetical protein WJX77_004923 [Trebouxia sp. C0004]
MKHVTERVLKSYEHMRDDVTWNPVIAGLAEGCWGDSRQQALQSKNHLASMSKLDCSLLVLSANCEPALRPCNSPLQRIDVEAIWYQH